MPPAAAPAWQSATGRAALRLCRLGELSDQDHGRWDELSAAAPSSGIFAKSCFLRPSLEHCDPAGEAVLAIVVDMAGEWLGLMPLCKPWHYGRVPFPNWQAWRHPNMFSAALLVRPGHEELFWENLLAGLEQQSSARPALRLVDLPSDLAVCTALLAICEAQGRPIKFDRVRSRAMLEGGTFAADGQLEVKPDNRRRYAALDRKLEAELGPIAFRVHRDPAAVLQMAEEFIRLEQSGWKGRAGSALGCDQGNLAFFQAMIAAAVGEGLVELAELRAGEHTLALSVHFFNEGDWGHGFKSAFDEDFAAFAPGVLLLLRLSEHFRHRGILPFDSCSAPDQHPVGSLWPARREFVDCGVALGGVAGRSAFRLLGLTEQMAHAGKGRDTLKA